MYTFTALNMRLAHEQLEDRRRAAARRREMMRRRRSAATAREPGAGAVGPVVRTTDPSTFRFVLEQLGLVSEQHRFGDRGEDHAALRRLVAALVEVAATAGVADLPRPSRRAPAVVLLRTVAALATRTGGRDVATDRVADRRLRRRLDRVRRATAPGWLDPVRTEGSADVVEVRVVDRSAPAA